MAFNFTTLNQYYSVSSGPIRRINIEDQISIIIPDALAGRRLDQALAELLPDFSRSRLQKWIKNGMIMLDGDQPKNRDTVYGGQLVELAVVLDEETQWQAEPIPLNIVFEDQHIIVVNKPAGMVVHPGAGNHNGTLCNGLLHHRTDLKNIPRAGIVHRLDKDTSGLLVVAASLEAHNKVISSLQAREVSRQYVAMCNGVMTAGGKVDAPIGRHKSNRLRMAVREDGKSAITHYRVKERFRSHTLVSVSLETGRTHQIRVHMAYIHYPLVGDMVYGGRLKIPPGCSESFVNMLRSFRRQALHAEKLGLHHPQTGEWMEWSAPVPEDMHNLVEMAREDLASTAT